MTKEMTEREVYILTLQNANEGGRVADAIEAQRGLDFSMRSLPPYETALNALFPAEQAAHYRSGTFGELWPALDALPYQKSPQWRDEPPKFEAGPKEPTRAELPDDDELTDADRLEQTKAEGGKITLQGDPAQTSKDEGKPRPAKLDYWGASWAENHKDEGGAKTADKEQTADKDHDGGGFEL